MRKKDEYKREFLRDLGCQLREMRDNANMTQEEVAEELDLTQGYVSRAEHGKHDSAYQMMKMVNLYKERMNERAHH